MESAVLPEGQDHVVEAEKVDGYIYQVGGPGIDELTDTIHEDYQSLTERYGFAGADFANSAVRDSRESLRKGIEHVLFEKGMDEIRFTYRKWGEGTEITVSYSAGHLHHLEDKEEAVEALEALEEEDTALEDVLEQDGRTS